MAILLEIISNTTQTSGKTIMSIMWMGRNMGKKSGLAQMENYLERVNMTMEKA